MVHTDDRLALLEVAKQLDVEADLGDTVSVSMLNCLPILVDMDYIYVLILLCFTLPFSFHLHQH